MTRNLLRTFIFFAVTVTSLWVSVDVSAQNGSNDPTFNPTDNATGSGASNTVLTSALQSDGKLLIGGLFTTYNNFTANRIARVNTNGANDATFTTGTGANAQINTIAVQSDGKILIGGNFTQYNGTSIANVARLNSDGTLDGSFTPGAGYSNVRSIRIQTDGKILIAGDFTTGRIARLNSDGTPDAAFTPGTGADGAINWVTTQSDGKIIIGGAFANYNGTARNKIARLNTNGTVDTGFNPGTGADNDVITIAVQSDDKILIGGTFTQYAGTARKQVARLNTDGTLDATFSVNMNVTVGVVVNAIFVQTDNKIVLGGSFTIVGSGSDDLDRVTTTGTLDASFVRGSGANLTVNTVQVRPTDGKILVGGTFLAFSTSYAIRLAQLLANGNVDTAFNPVTGAAGAVNAIAIQSDSKIIFAGSFPLYNNTQRGNIVRTESDGSIDLTYTHSTGASGQINSIAKQTDGKIIIVGSFSLYNGTSLNRIARINTDGTVDAFFNPGTGANNAIQSIAIQADGKIIISGNFTTFNGTARNRIARLNADGTVDTSFDPGAGPSAAARAIGLQSDGKIIIGGAFVTYNGTSKIGVARLNTDGTLDATFAGTGTNSGSTVNALSVLPGNQVLIAGNFSSYNGTAANDIARINTNGSIDAAFSSGTGTTDGSTTGGINAIAVLSNSKIVVGGDFTNYNGTSRNYIALLDTNGALDTAFDPGTGANGVINTIAVQPDGYLMIGGLFSSYNGATRNRIARVINSSCSTPATPGTISGTAAICSATSNTYSVAAVAGATSYTWTLPSGWTGTSTTNSITTTASTTSGNVSVTANNACGSSLASTLAVTVTAAAPAQPGTITGDPAVCSATSETYSVAAVSGATSYTWTLPSGWTGTSTTNSITVTTSTTAGNISVVANNGCGSSTARTLAVTVSTGAPAQPGTISGDAAVCSAASKTYSVTAVAGATAYTWTLPSGWTGASTTNSITVTTGTSAGNISVTANNICGASTARTMAVTVTTAAPAQPGVIAGDAAVCAGDSKTYSVTAVAGATSYTWTFPSGWTGTSTTNSITVTTGTSGGNISVTANNTCGASTVRTMAATVTTAAPAQPGTITGDAAVCSATSKTYSVTAVAGATSYTWTLPSGWTGTSTTNSITVTTSTSSGNISVVANNTCGASTARTLAVTTSSTPAQPGTITGDAAVCSGSSKTYSVAAVAGATSYTWTLPGGWTGTSTTNSITTTASATSGNITVIANNTCGSSTARTLAVTASAAPAQPGAITGDAAVCPGASKTYTVAAVAGATSYTWTLPSGWTGTSTTNSITTTTNANTGNITVTANNVCGASTARTLAITTGAVPAQPGVITGDAAVCSGMSKTYSVTAVVGATSYTWTLPTGWTGTSTTNSITTTTNANIGNITVTANNTCGASTARTLTITAGAIPAQPGTITGDNSVCSGSSNTYSVAAVGGATSYTWTLPSGWTGTSTTNSITTTASTNGGTISVTANSGCGSSSARTLIITTTAAPAKPVIAVDETNPQSLILSTVTAATSYEWFKDGEGAGTSATLTVSSSGVYTVKVANSAGCTSVLSDAQTISITGIEDELMRHVNIHPNPATDWLVVSLGGLTGKKMIAIYDLHGKQSLATVETSSDETRLSVKDYANGVYLLKIKSDKAVKVIRFTKQ